MSFMFPTSARVVRLWPFEPIPKSPISAVAVRIGVAPETLHLQYMLRGDLARLRIPPPKPSRQTDELWRHTCFEAFLRVDTGVAYHELNVSPSTEWALYAFADYRRGMAAVNVAEPPKIKIEYRLGGWLVVDVQLDLKVLPPSRALALAAVIERDDGRLSYWALKHPAAKPDFHHADGFVLEI
jgi:hypothetical protein